MACRVFESAVINSDLMNVWEKIRPFTFNFWKKVKKVEVGEKDVEHGEVGGIHIIYYVDDTMDKVKLQEMSDRKNLLSYEVLETTSHVSSPDIKVSHSLQLREVTNTNQCVLECISNYSNAISITNFIESKNIKKDLFHAIRQACTDPDDTGNRSWICHHCSYQNTPKRIPHYKCTHCHRVHMFTKLFRIPCNLDTDIYDKERFWMCGNEWQIIVLMNGHVEHPGLIACYLKCLDLRGHHEHFKCHFIFSSLHPDEARLKNCDRKHKTTIHDDFWVAGRGEDSGFWDQCSPEKCQKYKDSKERWGLMIQMIPGDRQQNLYHDWIDNHIVE